MSPKERDELEKNSRKQSSSSLWFESHRVRITGSKCGRIILQKKKTEALLRYCLYPKPMNHLPKSISWGIQNEPKARDSYVNYMNSHGHPGLFISKSGFIIHNEKGWLGASPDAWVSDPSVIHENGLAEFKCPFSKAKILVEEACKNPDFYCK